MSILLNEPILAIIFFGLLCLFLITSRNKYGKPVSNRKLKNLIKKYGNDLQIVDIRIPERFDDIHINNSICVFRVKDKIEPPSPKKPLLVVHDSEFTIHRFLRKNKIDDFPKNVYQLNINTLHLSHYFEGQSKGKFLSPTIKNS